jgi:hypothetical protein
LDNVQGQLDALSNIYNAIEEGKGTITTFTFDQRHEGITTLGDPYMKKIISGPTRVTMEIDLWM